MKKANTIVSILTLVLGVTIFTSAAAAQDAPADKGDKYKAGKVFKRDGVFGKRGFGRRGMMRGGMFMRGIDLTEEQKQQIRAIREANRPDEATVMEMRTLMRAKFEGTITPEQEARLNTLRDQRIAAQRSIRDQINNLLTAEQRTKIQENKQKMEQRFREMIEKRKAAKAAPKIS